MSNQTRSPFTNPNNHPLGLTTPRFIWPLLLPFRLLLLCLRIVLAILAMFISWFVMKLCLIGARVPVEPDDPPYGPIRRALLSIVLRATSRVALFVLGFFWVETSKSITAERKQQGDNSPRIIVSNHIGFHEILWVCAMHAPSFVATSDTRKLPYVGTLTEAMQCIFVDRLDSESRQKTSRAIALRTAKDANACYPKVAIFPEGCTTNGTAVIDMQKGAFRPGVPLRVYSCCSPFCFFSPTFTTNTAVVQMLSLMFHPFHRLHCRDLGCYSPSQEEIEDASQFALNVQKLVASGHGLAVSPLTCYDSNHAWAKRRREKQKAKQATQSTEADNQNPPTNQQQAEQETEQDATPQVEHKSRIHNNSEHAV